MLLNMWRTRLRGDCQYPKAVFSNVARQWPPHSPLKVTGT